jgi:predicted ribosomally synthesized peptide with nif11-like leader
MSMDAVEAFFEKAKGDPGLQAEIAETIDGVEEYGCCTLADLAVRHGFEFTAVELHEAIEELRDYLDGRELTDEDLEAVAGGSPDFAPMSLRVPFFVPNVKKGFGTPTPTLRYAVSGSAAPRYAVPPRD